MNTTIYPIVVASQDSLGLNGPARADVTAFGPTPYLSFADSPFSSTNFTYFHLETFEDHLLNTPGVRAGSGGVTSVVFGPNVHDSVDADDGLVDGSGLNGDSYFASGPAAVTFTFNSSTLGSLPTHAGIVWTDGGFGASAVFTVFGPSNETIFTATTGGFADFSNNGETSEDRFFGAVNAAGISSISISSAAGGGGMEVDHLQYGVAVVPEPAIYVLMLAGLFAIGKATRRHREA